MGKNWITSTFHISIMKQKTLKRPTFSVSSTKPTAVLEVVVDVANNDGRLDCDAIKEHFPNIDED